MFRLCLLGAESTGKTTLAEALADTLRARGHDVVLVPELLREWCVREGRMPSAADHAQIAQAHDARLAASRGSVLVADTSPLMVALYAASTCGDNSLVAAALAQQRQRFDLHLVTGLDLPWMDDGLGRESPASRDAMDALLRRTLQGAGISFRVVYGSGDARLAHALRAVDEWLDAEGRANSRDAAWVWNCEKCSDPECEHRLFSRLTRDTDKPA